MDHTTVRGEFSFARIGPAAARANERLNTRRCFMDIELLQNKFARMGADVRVRADARLRSAFTVDVKRDGKARGGDKRGGEYFEVAVRSPRALWMEAIAVEPRTRHLVLSACEADGDGLPSADASRQHFLCGHD